jgi:hypothetical protein
MTIELPRRQFLRVLTGLIAAPAVIKADALMRIVAPKPLLTFDALGYQYERYVTWFRIMPPVPENCPLVMRITDIDTSGYTGDGDIFKLLTASAHERAEGSVAAGNL